MYLCIFLHAYVNVYLHILHNHIGMQVPEETKVMRVMLAIFFFVFSMTKYLTKEIFEKEVLILPLSVRIKSIIRIQGRGRRSVAS